MVERIEIPGLPPGTRAEASRFTGMDGVTEWHLTVSTEVDGTNPTATLEAAWLQALERVNLNPASTLFRRAFCRDVFTAGMSPDTFASSHPGAFSCIGQAPVAGDPLALWSQHLVDPQVPIETTGSGSHFRCHRGSIHHHWFSNLYDVSHREAEDQTRAILEAHDRHLVSNQLTLADHVLRTWWYVRNIDTNYKALVDVRRSFFENHGLNENTHFIASTGIEGNHHDPLALVSLDSYAVSGLVPGQVEFLNAPDHLGPTHDYGVTFERATAISYADRKHILISGTASIDPSGNIVHPGNVMLQLERTLENIGALLSAAEASLEDLMVILVYVRLPEDGFAVTDALYRKFPHLPMVIVRAPVCRPGWLVEIEGLALIHADNPSFPKF